MEDASQPAANHSLADPSLVPSSTAGPQTSLPDRPNQPKPKKEKPPKPKKDPNAPKPASKASKNVEPTVDPDAMFKVGFLADVYNERPEKKVVTRCEFRLYQQ